MSSQRTPEEWETLLMKAVDGLLDAEERSALDAHLKENPELAAELADYRQIKETTDAMTARILRDADIEPPRPTTPASTLISASYLLLLLGGLLLLGFAGYTFATDAEVPTVVKVGAGAVTLGLIGLLGYVLRVRARAAGRDPYKEIDQ